MVLALFQLSVPRPPLWALIPLKTDFQGRLEESGEPVTGVKSFVFRIYDAVTGGNLIWTSQVESLSVNNGVFSVVLQTGTPVNLSTSAFSGARWMELSVNGSTFSPRQELVSSPFAMVAQSLAPDGRIDWSQIDNMPLAASFSVNEGGTAIVNPAAVLDLDPSQFNAADSGGQTAGLELNASSVTLQGNSFNEAGRLVRLDAAGALPPVSGSALTGINASNLATGMIPSAVFSGAYLNALSFGSAAGGPVSFSTNVVISGSQFRLGNFPSNPSVNAGAGALYYNTSDGLLYSSNGSSWIQVGAGGAASPWVSGAGAVALVVPSEKVGIGKTPVEKLDVAGNIKTDYGVIGATLNISGMAVIGGPVTAASATFANDLKAGGVIMSGSDNIQITTPAGFLDAGKLVNALPAISGAALTDVNSAQFSSLAVDTTTLRSAIDGKQQASPNLTTLAGLDGSGLTGLNATNLAVGTVPDARLSGNIVTASADQTIGGMKIFSSSVTVNNPMGAAVGRIAFAHNVAISSAEAANYGGVHSSSHVFVSGDVYAAVFHGSAAGLSGFPSGGGDSLGTHVATKTLDMGNFNIVNGNFLAASSAAFSGAIAASSGTFYGDAAIKGVILAGSGNNQITTAAGLLDAGKLTNALPAISGAALTNVNSVQLAAIANDTTTIKSQLDGKQAASPNLTTLAGLDGSGLAGLNASNLAAGVIPSAVFSGAYLNALTFGSASGGPVAFSTNVVISAAQLKVGNFAADPPTNSGPGAIYYNTGNSSLYVSNGSAWTQLAAGGVSPWIGGGTGSVTLGAGSDNVGIGKAPVQKLDVAGNIRADSGIYAATLQLSNSTLGAMDVAGGIQAGSGNVNIVGLDGRIPALTSTYFSSLDGSALTSLNASSLGSGTIPPGRILGSYTGISGVGTLTEGTWNASSISTSYTSAKDTTDDSWTGTGNLYTTSGNVGIGTASPQTKLDVSGSIRSGLTSPTVVGIINGASVQPTDTAFVNVEGSNAAPVTGKNYNKPALYLERWDNSSPSLATEAALYSNAYMTPIAVIEGRAKGGTATLTGISAKVQVPSGGGVPAASGYVIHGGVFLAELNPGAGQNNREAWALNPIVSWQSGNAPANLVGIEVDMLNSGGDASTLRPGAGGNNYTAYWAQAGGNKIANTGFYLSHTGTSAWRYGAVFDSDITENVFWGRTSRNSPAAKGIYVKTQYSGDAGRVFEAWTGDDASPVELFRITGDTSNPVYLRVGGAIKRVEVGAADSCGTGYKCLRVAN